MVSMLDSSPNVVNSLLDELQSINVQITALIGDSINLHNEGVPF